MNALSMKATRLCIRNATLCSLVLLGFIVLATSAPVPAAAQDSSALDFTATALDGTVFSGESMAGKAVLLDFWGSWCAPCIHAFPTLRRLHDEFGEALQIVGLAYYSGELSDIDAFAAEYELGYTIVEGHDEALDKFEVFAFPSYVLISADGEVIFSRAGEVADLYERVVGALKTSS